jgi:hypothetical protein
VERTAIHLIVIQMIKERAVWNIAPFDWEDALSIVQFRFGSRVSLMRGMKTERRETAIRGTLNSVQGNGGMAPVAFVGISIKF